MAVDAITLEVIYNATQQIINQLTINMLRTGYSTILKEAQDVTFAIFDELGRLAGQYFVDPIHLGVIGGQVEEVIKRYRGDMKPEDSFIVNHPYQRCQNHPTDVTLISPIFYRDEMVGYVGNTAHKPDLGGKVPGTNAGDATDTFQDGLLIPPLKLYRGGELSQEIYELIWANNRTPEITWGDIRGQALTNVYGAGKVVELMDKYGKDPVLECWGEWIHICERELRKEIAKIPDGVYGPCTDYMDDDGIQRDKPFYITVTMEKKGDELHFIFDSEEQARGPINIRPCITRCVTEYCVKAALAPYLPNNHGTSLPIKITLPPEGSLLNPRFPASVNMYAMTTMRITPTIMMVLAQAIPDKVPAPASGGTSAYSFAGHSPRTGRRYSQYEIIAGGYGARPTKDGVSGMDADGGNTRNTPVEAVEIEFPVMVDRFEIVPDTEGPGKFRGGMGIRRDWRITSEEEVVFNVRADRFKFSAQGVFGAKPARPTRGFINPGKADEAVLRSKVSNIYLKKDDVVSIELAGGGGWGSPLDRDPRLVLEDVIDGYISVRQAREAYGIVIRTPPTSIDIEETQQLRNILRSEGGDRP